MGSLRKGVGYERKHATSRYIFVTMASPWRQPIWGYLCAQANEQRETKAKKKTKPAKNRNNNKNNTVYEKKRDTAIRRRTCQFSLQTKAKRFAPHVVWAQIATPHSAPLSAPLMLPTLGN